MNKKEKLLKIFSNNKPFHFSLDYYGLLLCAVVCIIYFVRKSISKIIDFKKKSRTYTVNTSNQNNPRNYNVALYNPELQTIGMTYLGMVVSCVITSSGIYVWYFSKDKTPMWSELERPISRYFLIPGSGKLRFQNFSEPGNPGSEKLLLKTSIFVWLDI